ncbi:DUF3298 and DUF4163 domain-containing protein [Paenibacillus glacialis]|uniref:Anti-sigma factor n=1 Tax=Paenibacillus glacialis TaxID=494026 RepID=A0A168F7R0_9BACL|nr:DUF3298 and DUF4163 domain-containing protein [Paenibacillus glacialis]OAB35941.1 anti-sigma factor [Paenibacillus glacialis]
MDNKMNKLIEDYKQVPIPDELDLIVGNALKKRKNRRIRYNWISGVSAAAIFFVIGINANANIANALSTIPGVDSIVKVLTFREYKVDEQTYNADIKVPMITNLDNKELESDLNERYLEENKKLYDEFQAEMESMKKSGDGHLGVDTGFEVKTDNDDILAIGRYVVNTVASSSTTMKHDTIDKKNQILLSLPMLFKDDRYISIISENIKDQMRAQMKADENQFYWVSTEEPDDGLVDEFEHINKDQDFYINDQGQLVISFNKYDVAPGYMGVVEFVIPTDVIADALVSNTYIN